MAVTRRKFQHLSLALYPLVLGVGVVLAALRYLMPLPRRPRLKKLDVGKTADYFTQKGAVPVELEFNDRKVYVLHDGTKIRAFDAMCTHLGCNVLVDEEHSGFLCPCHSARFANDGTVTAKPATTPLAEFAVAPIGEDGSVVILDKIVQPADQQG